MLKKSKWAVKLGILLLLIVFSSVGLPSQAQVEFDPTYATQLDYIPTYGTFYSIQGNSPPVPFDPNPQLNLYYDGVSSIYWYDDSGLPSGGGFMAADDFPGIPSGTNDIGSSSGPAVEFNLPVYSYTSGDPSYYYYFWLQILCDSTNSLIGQINILNTLPGMYYEVLTNADLNNTGSNSWNTWVTLLATSTNTPAPPLSLNQPNLNFRGKIILPGGSYITNGLVAYWKMNDASGINAADSSGYAHPLSLSNTPSWGPGDLILNGTNQFGDAGTNAAEIVYQDMTICAWINQTSNAFKGIVDKSFNYTSGEYGGWGLWVQSDGHLMFHAGDTDTNDGPGIIPAGEWCFVSLVWHLSTQKADFYINGIFNGESGLGTVVNYGTYGLADLQVGNLQTNLSNGLYAFNGSIRNIGIYNRALSSAEIQTNYLNTAYITNVTVPDLLYYKMTEYNPSNPTNYPFSLTDSSLHGGTTGTYGGPTNHSEIWTNNPAGISNSALHFSGGLGIPGGASGTYIETSNSALFNFTNNSFTINLWLHALTPDGYVIGNNTYHSNGWFMAVQTDKLYFGSDTPGSESAINTVANLPYADNTVGIYNMVTVTRNGTNTPLIYLNGLAVPVTGSFGNPAFSSNTLKLARGVSTNAYDLDGEIWLPQIWSRDLSPSEIINLYTNQLSGYPWP